MFKIIDYEKLKKLNKVKLEQNYNKETINCLELIIELESDFKLISYSKLIEHQNTSFENYPYILKDFISEINKSVNIIVDSLRIIYKNFPEIIVDNPILLGHEITYNIELDLIESYTIKKHYCNYLNFVNDNGYIVSTHLRRVKEDILDRFNNYMLFNDATYYYDSKSSTQLPRKNMIKNGELLKYTMETIFDYNAYQGKREVIYFNLLKELKSVYNKYELSMTEEEKRAYNYFLHNKTENELIEKSVFYSINLIDEQIIPKKSQVLFYKDNEYKFQIIAIDSINFKKNSYSWSYDFICSFDISFYIKSKYIETYTNSDVLTFFSIYKDFLATFNYLNFAKKKNFNQSHPMIKEANLFSEVTHCSEKFDRRLEHYKYTIEEICNNNQSLITTKRISEWCDLLGFKENIKKYFTNVFYNKSEPTSEELLFEIIKYANNAKEKEINKLLDNEEKLNYYNNIKMVISYLEKVVNLLFGKLYTDEENINLDNQTKKLDMTRYFNKRDKATFHTTLKDSIIIDHRTDTIKISETASKHLTKECLDTLVKCVAEHKYHDYLEVDIDYLDNDNKINELINFFNLTNKFNFPIKIKNALKLRKLGNYKAEGIYFLYSKQIGIDFRKGFKAYIHEIAHHIDLNTKNYDRPKMVNFLLNYSKNRIFKRVEYFLKAEELIARAAEVSMILLLGRYEEFKKFYDNNEIDEYLLVQSIETTFKKSKFSTFLNSIESYRDDIYFDYKKDIINKKFTRIEFILQYYKNFWSTGFKNNLILKSLDTVEFENVETINIFVKKNEYSYNYFYRDIFKIHINLTVF